MDIVAKCVAELGVQSAIEEKIDLLYDRLKEEQESGGAQGLNALLPTISIFINYASTRPKLTSALDWLRDTRGIESRDDAMWTLATLTLRQVVETGLAKHAEDAEKVTAWTEMRDAIAATVDAIASNSPAPVRDSASVGA